MRLNKLALFVFLSLCFPLLFAISASAALAAAGAAPESGTPAVVEEEIVFHDILRRDTPRGTVIGFEKATRNRDYATSAKFLDLSHLSQKKADKDGPELARQLRIVLDQKLTLSPGTVDNTYEGQISDGRPAYREFLGRIHSEDKSFDIVLERVKEGKELKVWKVSNDTVKNIHAMHKHFGTGILGEYFPASWLELEFLGVVLAEWAVGVIFLLASYIVVWLLTRLLLLFSSLLKIQAFTRFIEYMLRPLRWLMIVLLVWGALKPIAFSVTLKQTLESGTLITLFFLWFLLRLLDLIFNQIDHKLQRRGNAELNVLFKLVRKVSKVLLVVVGVTIWMDNAGFKVSTLLTGIGIGGLAFALAAQKSIEDIIGAVILLTSRPVRVGDFIRFEGKLGTVEEITLRFTKVRTLGRTMLYIANGQFATLHLENFTQRDMMWYHPQLWVGFDTPAEKIQAFMQETEAMLREHPKVNPQPARIRFEEIGSYAYKLAVFAYVNTSDYDEYLVIAQELNLSLLDVIKKMDIELTRPAQNVFLEGKGNA